MWLFSFFCFFGRHQEWLFVCHVGSHPPSFFLDGYQKHISGPRLLRCKGRTVCFTVASYDRVSEPACLMHLCRAFLRRSFHLWAVRSLGAFSANTRSRRMSRKVLSSACGRCDRYLVFSPSWEPCLCWCFHQPFPWVCAFQAAPFSGIYADMQRSQKCLLSLCLFRSYKRTLSLFI